ncbi:MAG: hypothetical protein GX447_02985 [Elusimicrobia bacterium]|nr:hypothetical protein [Elusimicrobiota bacterium]
MAFRILILILSLGIFSYASLDEASLSLKKDLKSKIFQKVNQKNIKIAVINFKDIGEQSVKAKAGEIIASALSNHFINDSDFIFVERNRMDKVFEELKLNVSGAIDEKEIKRVGIILGVDWIITGEVSFAENEFIANARVINPETAEVIAAASANIEKETILKETSELYNLSKNYFLITGGLSDFSDLEVNTSQFGLELRHNYSKKSHIKFSFKKTANNSELLDKVLISKWDVGNPSDDIYAEEKISSISSFEITYGFVKKLMFNTRLKAEAGAALNMLSSKQRIYYKNGSTSMGTFNIPVSNETTYYLPGINIGIGIEKNIFKSHILSFDVKYGKLKKLKRELDAGNNSQALQNYINSNINSKKISSDYLYAGISLGFPF